MLLKEMAANPVADSKPDPASPAAPISSAAERYDFSRPDRIPADQLRAMQPIHENFARGFGLNLSAYLRTLASVSVVQVEQLSFAEFSRKIAPPVTLMPLRLHPHSGVAMLQLSHQAVFPVLEMLLGGAPAPPENIDRELTAIEKSVFEPVLRILVQELRASWNILGPIEFVIRDPGAAPQVVSSIAPSEPVLAISFELRIDELVGGFQLGAPLRVVQPLLAALEPREEPPSEDDTQILHLLERAQVTADVRLNGLWVLFRDLISLEPGDVLAFDHPLGKELLLELNGTPKFRGHVVAVGNRRGFQVKGEFDHSR